VRVACLVPALVFSDIYEAWKFWVDTNCSAMRGEMQALKNPTPVPNKIKPRTNEDVSESGHYNGHVNRPELAPVLVGKPATYVYHE
jgi:hypothetical protein